MTFPSGPDRLADSLLERGVLTDPGWEHAVRRVPRRSFIPATIWPRDDDGWRSPRDRTAAEWEHDVYADYAIVTQVDDGHPTGTDGRGRVPTNSISQPSLVVTMLQPLDLRDDERVLEIGTGTGYNTALLCERLGEDNVVSIEVDEDVAAQARETLHSLGYKPTLLVGDGAAGAPERAPFDRVLATVAARHVPPAWIQQTPPGGVVVAPWGTGFTEPVLLRLLVANDAAHGRIVGDAPFMWLRGQRTALGGAGVFIDVDTDETTPARITVNPRIIAERDAGWETTVGVLVPGVDYVVYEAQDDSGEASIYVFDRDGSRSWALGEYVPYASEYESVWHGPRDLWAEIGAARQAWETAGCPGRDRLGLTVTPEGQHTLWVDTPTTSYSGDALAHLSISL
ncbi:methyltransferase domain-containing protein [Salinactinospora qingdaonensis]|uniref:Protein-L-isoaspartate O-methyltransferase n=1 Tax=Salinactinospora qingdaonensis TaxID=702744 RepID=A0ABP7EZL3_9ACTN